MPSAGTEELLAKVQHVTNEYNTDGEITKPAVRYLTMQERVDREKELKNLDDQLGQPDWVLSRMQLTADRIHSMRSRRGRLKKELEKQSPPTDLTGEQKDALYKLEGELADQIRTGMVGEEDMRRNPAGAVDRNIRWLKATKGFQLTWKNVRRLLNPDSEEKDLANVDMLRPRAFIPGGPSIMDTTAQAVGVMSYSHIPDDKWTAAGLPLVNENSPLAQVLKRDEAERVKELEAQVALLKDKLVSKADAKAALNKQTKENRDKARERMKEYWKNKKAAQHGEVAQAE